ncbi:hypothetical protein DERP_008735 [Dermatophagoides pteronyssinus]|uniref:Secreted protein n=1 Tax=Dermatophagoides pteronyssinus TaxID=6956 RepID=A0ABQ8IWU1_DERPT|nr:hypothetical protein DERP_008735 [Dermatophagoides pteronyssinus]
MFSGTFFSFFSYITCAADHFSANLPSTSNERLILFASTNVPPLLLVRLVFSLPARSTRQRRPSLRINPFFNLVLSEWIE